MWNGLTVATLYFIASKAELLCPKIKDTFSIIVYHSTLKWVHNFAYISLVLKYKSIIP
jgi:hypothetical protein